jgi:hypothetical protein
MSRTNSILMTAVALASFLCGQPGERSIPAGTIVQVRNNQTIDSKNAAAGQVFAGLVTHDVTDRTGHVVIPGGSPVELVVRSVSKHHVALDRSLAGGIKSYPSPLFKEQTKAAWVRINEPLSLWAEVRLADQ